MRTTSIIFRRELASYLRSPVGYIIGAFCLLMNGIWFQSIAMKQSQFSADILTKFFFTSSLITMVLGILLSFRQIAEERQSNTLVLLNTAPVRDVEIVLGKFLASFVFLSLLVLANALHSNSDLPRR